MKPKEAVQVTRVAQLVFIVMIILILLKLGYDISLTDELLLIIAMGVWGER